jgi:hypothetical protein
MMGQVFTMRVEQVTRCEVLVEVRLTEAELDTTSHKDLERKAVEVAQKMFPHASPIYSYRSDIIRRVKAED